MCVLTGFPDAVTIALGRLQSVPLYICHLAADCERLE